MRAVLARLAVEVVEVSPSSATEATFERLGARVVLVGGGDPAVRALEVVGAARRRGVTVIVGSDRGLDDATLDLLRAGASDYVATDRLDRELAPRVATALVTPDAALVRRRERVLAGATRGLEALASDRASAAGPALSEEERERIAVLLRVAVQR